MLTKTQLLQQRINEIIEPDVEKRLTFGCEVLFNNKIYTIGIDSRFIHTQKIISLHKEDACFFIDKFTILGKQPNLEMLLLALQKMNPEIDLYLQLDKITVFTSVMYEDYDFYWHLNIPFENQPEETINTICKILNVEI